MKAIWIIVVLALAVGGMTIWLTADDTHRAPREAILEADQTYDATGGQQMWLRW